MIIRQYEEIKKEVNNTIYFFQKQEEACVQTKKDVRSSTVGAR
jgi:hypothetical protein